MIAESIVVYRSKFEQMQDEAITDFIQNNPGIIAFIAGFLIVVIIGSIFADYFRRRR